MRSRRNLPPPAAPALLRLPRVLSLLLVLTLVLVLEPAPAVAQDASSARQPASASAASQLGYYRTPSIRGNTLIFSAEGDLWTVPVTGGEARRLTTHPAEETNPVLSPDGRTVAFTASYEGPAEVYLMPVAGGLPRRLTWDGSRDLAIGWTRAGKVVYSTTRFSTLPAVQLVEVDTATLARTVLPLAQAADATLDPQTGTLFFTRFARQSSNNRNYKGGTAQNIWKYEVQTGPGPGPGPKTPEAAPVAGANAPANKASPETNPNPNPGPKARNPNPSVEVRSETGMQEAAPLTSDYPGTSRSPLFWNNRLIFASDRSGLMNLWSMSPDGKDLKQLTSHKDFEVQSPAIDDGRVVYQLGADLWLYDAKTGQDSRLPITLASDYDQLRPRWIRKPLDWATSAHLSPDGDRVVLTARGQLFVAPVGPGRLVEATKDPSARARYGRFLDARTLIAMSDASGEVELWRVPANGIGQATRLTSGGDILRWDPVPSPDGRWVAHTDKNNRLWLKDAGTGRTTKLADNPNGLSSEVAWSPDSRRVAYRMTSPNQFDRLYLYDVAAQATTPVTSDRYDSYSPVFSPDGKWLWFLSDRTFRSVVGSPWGARQPEPFFDKQTRIYALQLDPAARFPFAPADELHPVSRRDSADGETAGQRDSGKKRNGTRTDSAARDNAPSRRPAVPLSPSRPLALYEVPGPAGNYSALATDGKRLLYMSRERGATGPGGSLMALEITNEKPQPKELLDGVSAYEVSRNSKKLLVRKEDGLYVMDVASVSKEKLADARLDLSGWSFQVEPRRELAQMFTEAWRLERDYYWDPAMRGLDWKAVQTKYAPLAARVTSRTELSDVLAQMVAELETLHTYVRGGDIRTGPDTVLPASLGARLEKTPQGFRVAHVFRSDPDEPAALSPLAKPGVDVHEGDVITAINGTPLASVADVGEVLRNQAGKQVLLEVVPNPNPAAQRRNPNPNPAVKKVVVPITPNDEADIRYTEWEYTRRLAVDSMSGGRIGYLHLRAMGSSDMAQFQRDFYPLHDRDALVVDMRNNNGGNIDSWVLEKLLRKPWMWWQDRQGDPSPNMQWAFRGPMVVLVNERTASDGEAFAEGFRRLGLGKVIGTRTWGGEIWLSASNVLVDRGIATAAESGVFAPDGGWLIEGHGVDPDLVVDNPPATTFTGRDLQLEAALSHLRAELDRNPPAKVKAPGRPKVTANPQ